MPEYVATLARNERHYSKWHFEAPDDQKAEAILKECEAAGTIPWEPDDETGDADALDPILWLDRCGGPGEKCEEVACESSFLARSIRATLTASQSGLRLWHSKTLVLTPERHSIP